MDQSKLYLMRADYPTKDTKQKWLSIAKSANVGFICQILIHHYILFHSQEVKDTPVRTTRSTPQKTKYSTEKTQTPQKTSSHSKASSSRTTTPQKTPKSSSRPSKSPEKTSPSGSGSTPSGADGDKRRGNAMYRSYLNREGPRALGTKDIPEVKLG